MRALVSDIHSNIEAFSSVLKHIEQQKVDEIFCLGDFIGYGPNPREAIQMSRNFKLCLRGNHEDAVLFTAADFNEKARQAVQWTKDMLSSPKYDKNDNYKLWDFLDGLKEKHEENGNLFIHASPRFPTREYVMPPDIHNIPMMTDIFKRINKACFGGHTHIPGVFEEVEPGKEYRFQGLNQLKGEYEIGKYKCFVNIGSVGQPRDGDNRSSYVTLDGNVVRWHRLPYEYRETMRKIFLISELPDYLGERLEVGR